MKNNQHTSVDLSLFSKIPAQLSVGDKMSLLALIDAHGRIFGNFAYLEIGSHLGGSIAPFLQNKLCRKIYSIDKRPTVQPDDTGMDGHYPGNSTARMMTNLRSIDSSADEKVVCFDGDTASVAITEISFTPSICFIDGEHTGAVTYRDYQFCRKAILDCGTLVFHDANTLYLTLQRIIDDLNSEGCFFEAFCLADSMFVISLGMPKISCDESIMALMRQGGGYLPSLVINDHYRRFKNRKIFKWLRTLFGFSG